MTTATDIREHMEVVGSDGLHVGTVDHMDGERIKLTKSDAVDGHHHYVDMDLVERIDSKIHLSKPAEDVTDGFSLLDDAAEGDEDFGRVVVGIPGPEGIAAALPEAVREKDKR
jgi:hypothetical protein